MNIKVTDAPDRHRFEAWSTASSPDSPATCADGVIVFTHTEVDPAFEGHGVGGALARAALDEAAARGLRVRALCPFIAGWIARHPDYQHLTEAARGGGENPG